MLLIATAAVTWTFPTAAGAHTLTVRKAKRTLYAYADTQNAQQFRVRYCRRRSRHHVRCAVKEVFLEAMLGSNETWERPDYYWMAVKLRRPHSSSTTRSGVLIYDDIKASWVAWNGR
jgi:hypothetical protein